jgi:O-glycosyl hydrolase
VRHRIESQSIAANLEHVALENPGGQKVLILTNTRAPRAVEIFQEGKSAKVSMMENSIASLVWT